MKWVKSSQWDQSFHLNVKKELNNSFYKITNALENLVTFKNREHSGSGVECSTGDRGSPGSSLTGITVLCP